MLALLIAILGGIIAGVIMHSQDAFNDKENPEVNRGIMSVITSVVIYVLLAFSLGLGGNEEDEALKIADNDKTQVTQKEDGQVDKDKSGQATDESEEDDSLLGGLFGGRDREETRDSNIKNQSDDEEEGGLLANIFGKNKKKDEDKDSPQWVYDNTSNKPSNKDDDTKDELDDVVITPIFPGDKPGLGIEDNDYLANNDSKDKEDKEDKDKDIVEDKEETEKPGAEKPGTETPERPSKPEETPSKPAPEKPSKPEEKPSKPAPEKPSKPEEKPSKPEEKPSKPAPEKPGTDKPGTDKPEKPEKPGTDKPIVNKPPIIHVVKELGAVEGEEVDFTSFFEFRNGNNEVALLSKSIDSSEVDLSTPGTYSLYVTVTDTYGNVTSKAFSFRVEAKPVVEEPVWPEKPEETPEKPEETPEKPGEEKPEETPETPEKPGEDKPGTDKPETPEEPGTETPGEDKPETPEEPGTETPGEDKPETPEEPGTETPGEDKPETPEKPGEEKPEENPSKPTYEYEFSEVVLEPKEIIKEDPNMFYDEKKVVSEGTVGREFYQVTKTLVDGKVVATDKKLLSKTDVVDRIVIVGTKDYTINDIPKIQTGDASLDNAIYKINKYRVESTTKWIDENIYHIRPIAESSAKLNEIARIRAEEAIEMHKEGHGLTHDRPNGESIYDLMKEVGYVNTTGNIYENIVIASSWEDAIISWKASPGHNANLLRSGIVDVGVAAIGDMYVFIAV